MADGINTVLFDMDGVIFDSEILVLSSWKEVAGRNGIQDVEKVCHECLGTNSAVSKQIFLRHRARHSRCGPPAFFRARVRQTAPRRWRR